MKKFKVIVILIVVMCFPVINDISAQPDKLNIGIASTENSVYGEMISILSRSQYLQLIERKDLAPLFNELQLKQSGAVLGASDSRLKGIDYLIMVEKSQGQYNCRIVKTDTGEIIVGFIGSIINDIADKCIERLETDVALLSIEGLKNEEGLKVTINSETDSFRIGEKVEFTVRSVDSDGYLYLIDRQSDGSVTVLLPNSSKKEYKIKAGEDVVIPRDLGFNIRASEPAGKDKLIVIVTKTPINIFKFGLTAGDKYTEVSGKSKGVLSKGMSLELYQLKPGEWGITYKEVIIKR